MFPIKENNCLLVPCIVTPKGQSRPHYLINKQVRPFFRVIPTRSDFFDDHTALLWDVSRPRHPVIVARLTRHDQPVYAVAFSPDGRTLATGSYDDTIRLWDVTHPRRPVDTAVLTGHTNAVWSVAFSPDGRRLASGSADDTARIWDVSNLHRPRPIATLTGHTDTVYAVAFTPSGNTVLTGSADTTLQPEATRTVARAAALRRSRFRDITTSSESCLIRTARWRRCTNNGAGSGVRRCGSPNASSACMY